MPATTTGTDAGKSRDHNQGNQDRKYTVEQKAAVIRVRRCQPTAFYDILGLEEVRATVTEAEIKKAYRKISLLTHPDKNGHEHADEAFKMVSRAFGVLGDKEKRMKFDRYGGDPDSRFGAGGGGGGGFSGFAQRQASGGAGRAHDGGAGGMWEDEISPEEMFNRFFGGGFGGGGFGGGGMFNSGPQFVFNMGGGPGIRVHQFGGGRPQRRPQDPNAPAEAQASIQQMLIGLMPILIILILPLLSSLLSGSTPAGPSMRFDAAVPPHTMQRKTPQFKIPYFINPAEVEDFSASKFTSLDKQAENSYIHDLRMQCDDEKNRKLRLQEEAQGWIFPDMEKLKIASKMEMKACNRLDELSRLSMKQRS